MKLTLNPRHLVDGLDHVHRDADGPGLIGDSPGDRLPDPPRRVRRELIALGVVELLDRADQTEIALLDQVQEDKASADVTLRNRDNKAQVGLDQPLLCCHPVRGDEHELRYLRASAASLATPLQGLFSKQASLDGFGELDFVVRSQQWYPADLPQVDP